MVLWQACGEVQSQSDASDTDAAASSDGSVEVADAAPADAGPDAGPDAGGAPQVTVSPSSYEFGPVPLSSTSATATFTFTNYGAASATGCSVPTLGGANAGDFTIAADNCGTSELAGGGGFCTVMVTVTPSVVGLRTTTLSRTCSVGGIASTAANGIAVNRPMYIFISSVSYTGDIGGLEGADDLCNTLGEAGTLSGPMNKTWKALLSKATGGVVNAKDRFVWTGPIFDLGGKMVTQDPSTWPWVDAGANSKIAVNESGGGPDDSYVWTGSTLAGLAKGEAYDCNNWSDGTSNYNGWSGETGSFPAGSWFDSFGNGCGDPWFGLYCVSQ